MPRAISHCIHSSTTTTIRVLTRASGRRYTILLYYYRYAKRIFLYHRKFLYYAIVFEKSLKNVKKKIIMNPTMPLLVFFLSTIVV